MDISSIKEGISTLIMALSAVKQAKDLLPENTKRQEISNAIDVAERQLKIAESQIAHGLGYQLCKNHFPPEVMLSSDDETWYCPLPTCGNKKSTSLDLSSLGF